MNATDLRQVKGEAIAREFGWVVRVDENHYQVRSQTHDVAYDVVSTERGWSCSCPDFAYRGLRCKHCWAVEFSQTMRRKVESAVIIAPVNSQACPSCQSVRVVKHGVRHNNYGDIQQFLCNDCRHAFVVNLGFERMRATPQAITQAMQLYFTGESLRNVQRFLRLQGVNVSHVSVLKWIRKYVALMTKYLDQITPKVGDVWRADELYVKVKGDLKYLFAMMDDETRFWIAQQVSDHKADTNATRLFREAKQVAGKQPRTLITDGLNSYRDASRFEFPHTAHVREIRLAGAIHNNKMERMNGEVRDREKVMRGLKTADTPILKGYQLFHNYVRPHEALGGQTPADRCGVKVEGENKWLTIIQNARSKASLHETG